MRVEGGVAGEVRVVGKPKLHSWGKCTIPLTNINSDWMSNASSGLYYIVLLFIYAAPLSCILGCKYRLYNEVEVSTGYTLPNTTGTRLCIP